MDNSCQVSLKAPCNKELLQTYFRNNIGEIINFSFNSATQECEVEIQTHLSEERIRGKLQEFDINYLYVQAP